MLAITINGQSLLSMLAEEIALTGIKIIQINTDGILVKCTKDQRSKLDEICDRWMKLTKLKLDYDFFRTVAQRDVNNYLAEFMNGEIKYKGTFEIVKDWHKDHSMRVVSQAVSDFFINEIPVRETIESCRDIYDFCISQKVGRQFAVEYHHIKDGRKQIDEIQRINRFFVSNTGGTIIKRKREDDKVSRLISGEKLTLFNKYYDAHWQDYDVKYDFYVAKANKIIYAVESGQLDLFA